jgi:hypothetical protein
MLFDIGLVVACHFITANLVLLSKGKPASESKPVRLGAIVTITVGVLAIGDLIFRKISGIAG